jgi:predicted nucleotidyltransferase
MRNKKAGVIMKYIGKDRELKRYNFGDVVNAGGVFKYIYPIKQRTVKDILDTIPKSVERAVLFGSCITLECGIDSDIDICLIGNIKDTDLRSIHYTGSDVDLIRIKPDVFEEMKNDKYSIAHEVDKYGLEVYRRD